MRMSLPWAGGSDGEGQARGQARNALGEPPQPRACREDEQRASDIERPLSLVRSR
jgi:hypothetical protein